MHLKQAQREARQAQSVEAEEAIGALRKALRRQREFVFEVEDAIEAKRDALIAAPEKQIHRQSTTLNLFRIRRRLQ